MSVGGGTALGISHGLHGAHDAQPLARQKFQPHVIVAERGVCSG